MTRPIVTRKAENEEKHEGHWARAAVDVIDAWTTPGSSPGVESGLPFELSPQNLPALKNSTKDLAGKLRIFC